MTERPMTRKRFIIETSPAWPFLLAVILALYTLVALNNIELSEGVKLNIPIVLIVTAFQVVLFGLLNKRGVINLGLNKHKKLKRYIGTFFLIILTFISSFLLVMMLRSSMNYWFRSNDVTKLKVEIINKRISRGRATDYYLRLKTESSEYQLRVTKRKYNSYTIGDTELLDVNRGFFDGYFIIEE